MNTLLSIIIPSRKEKYLSKTIQDILNKATQEIEIIAVLDGGWTDVVNNDRVNYIHFTKSQGMRGAINAGVALARGKYILKCDGHVMFDKGFDEKLKANIESNWIVIPRRYALDVEKWEIEKRTDDKYPVDYEYLDSGDLHGINWQEKRDEKKDILIDEIISAQGSCWFTTKEHFENIGGLDEDKYGTFFLEFQELSFKTWTSGGKVMVNKNTHYSHWHKTDGRGYSLRGGERGIAVSFMKNWMEDKAWEGQKIPFKNILQRFMPMPGWKI
jgi:glycosyltransferase involved in cell wall biosynthesis